MGENFVLQETGSCVSETEIGQKWLFYFNDICDALDLVGIAWYIQWLLSVSFFDVKGAVGLDPIYSESDCNGKHVNITSCFMSSQGKKNENDEMKIQKSMQKSICTLVNPSSCTVKTETQSSEFRHQFFYTELCEVWSIWLLLELQNRVSPSPVIWTRSMDFDFDFNLLLISILSKWVIAYSSN